MESISNYRRKELNAEVCSVLNVSSLSLQTRQRRNISVINHIERGGHRPEKGI